MSGYQAYGNGMYERLLSIGEFTGLDQSRGLHSGDVGSSPDAVNFIARFGDLRTSNGVAKYGAKIPNSSYESVGGRLFQGFFRDEFGNDFSKIVMALHGRFYVSNTDAAQWDANWSDLQYK